MDYVPILFISAKTGQRVDQVLPLALQVQEERLVRLSTSQLNRILQKAQDQHASAIHMPGRQLKIYYGTQVRSDPPTFLLYVNDPKLAHFILSALPGKPAEGELPVLWEPRSAWCCGRADDSVCDENSSLMKAL